MAGKREHDDASEGEILEPEPKRSKTQSSKSRQHQNSGIDPTWGQKYVFSDLENATTIPHGEESEFEDDSDAMAYLMSVRQQAYKIPHLLVAPKVQIGPQLPDGFDGGQEANGEEVEEEETRRNLHNTSTPDLKGYYEDGAYIGLPVGTDGGNDGENGDQADEEGQESLEKALLEAYFSALMKRYLDLRSKLDTEPPPDAAKRLPVSRPTFAASSGQNSSTNKIWSSSLRNSDPHPLQLALMSKDSVLRVLRVVIGGKFLTQGYPVTERTSQWLWALLARLPDKGELSHTEIGWIRDLGRRAVLLGRSLAEMAALREQLAEDEFGENDEVDRNSSDDDIMAEEDGEVDGGIDVPETRATSASPAPSSQHIQDHDHSKDKVEDEEEEEEEEEEGEVNEDGDSGGEDVAMDLASDSDADEGEITEHGEEEVLEAAKRRLLAKLNASTIEEEAERLKEAERTRARMNMRATLNMVLTVAGEFYGQRDLLEFREPFVGL